MKIILRVPQNHPAIKKVWQKRNKIIRDALMKQAAQQILQEEDEKIIKHFMAATNVVYPNSNKSTAFPTINNPLKIKW